MAAGLTALREVDEVGRGAGHAVQEELDLDVTHAGRQRGDGVDRQGRQDGGNGEHGHVDLTRMEGNREFGWKGTVSWVVPGREGPGEGRRAVRCSEFGTGGHSSGHRYRQRVLSHRPRPFVRLCIE